MGSFLDRLIAADGEGRKLSLLERTLAADEEARRRGREFIEGGDAAAKKALGTSAPRFEGLDRGRFDYEGQGSLGKVQQRIDERSVTRELLNDADAKIRREQAIEAEADSVGTVARKFFENLPERATRWAAGIADASTSIPAPDELIFGKSESTLKLDAAVKKNSRALFKEATTELQRNAPKGSGLATFAYDAANAFLDMGAAVAATAATRSPTVGAALMGGMVFGDKYGESIAAGRTERQAMMDAAFYGAAEVLTERIPLKVLTQGSGSVLSRVGKGAAAEGIQEALTQGLQDGYDAGVIGEDMTLGEAIKNMAYAGLLGGTVGGALGGAVGAAQRFRRPSAAGAIERANVESDPTPEDEASPLPTDLIAKGKAMMQGATAKLKADATLKENAAPPTGSMVEFMGQRAIVEDAFTDENGESGVTLRVGDRTQKAYFADLEDAGVTLASVADPRENLPEELSPPSQISAPFPPKVVGKELTPADTLKARIRRAESGGNDAAKNPNSSATGRYQFTRETWEALGGDWNNRFDPNEQERLMDALVKQNEAALKKAGFEGSAGELYLAHFAGVKGALKLLRNPKGSAEVLLGQAAANANRSILDNKTAAEVIAWADKKMGGPGIVGTGTAPSELGIARFEDGTPAEPESDDEFEFLREPLVQEQLAAPAPVVAEQPRLADLLAQEEREFGEAAVPGANDALLPKIDQSEAVRSAEPFALPDIAAAPQESGFNPRSFTERTDSPAPVEPETVGDGTRAAPLRVARAADVEALADQVAQPTEAQAEAGNYKKLHLKVQGLDITVENPKGSERSGVDPDGKPWRTVLPAAYGYVKGSKGADGDQSDVYIGDNPASARAFVVDQFEPESGKFDEHKTVLGVDSVEEALAIYDAGFSDGTGPQRRRGVTEMPVAEFKEWVKSEQSAPLATSLSVAAEQLTSPAPAAATSSSNPAEAAGQPVSTSTGEPIKVYHGGPGIEGDIRAPFFVSADRAFAQTYAEDRGGTAGRVDEFDLSAAKVATEEDISAVARAAGVSERMVSEATGGMLLDENFTAEAPQIVAELQRQGFDAARFSDFAVDEERTKQPAFAVLNPAALTPSQSVALPTEQPPGALPGGGASEPLDVPAPAFDPVPLVPQLRDYIVKTKGSLKLPAVAKALGVSEEQANRVLGAYASRPGVSVRITRGRPEKRNRLGKVISPAVPSRIQRTPTRRGPVDVLTFVQDQGGVRDDEGHDLARGMNLNRRPGVIRKSGLSVDAMGELLHEAGYFATAERPTEAEVLELLDRGNQRKVYQPEEQADAEEDIRRRESDEEEARARADILASAEEWGLTLSPDVVEDALGHIARGESVDTAIELALAEAQVMILDDIADFTGNDYYAEIGGEIYEGRVAERRDRGAEEGVSGAGPAQGDEGGSRDAAPQPTRAEPPRQGEGSEPAEVGDLAAGSLALDAEQSADAKTPERQRQQAELEARQRQSKSRRGDQVGLGDQPGGLFSNERDQLDIEPERSGDRAVAQARAALQQAMDALDAADGKSDELSAGPPKGSVPLFDDEQPDVQIGWVDPKSGDITPLRTGSDVVAGRGSDRSIPRPSEPVESASASETSAPEESRNAAPAGSGTDMADAPGRVNGGPKLSLPVATLTGAELGTTFASPADMPALREAAIKWYDANLRGKEVTTSDGRTVRFNRTGRTKSTSAKGDRLLRSVPAIRAILENGRLIESRPGRDRGTKVMHLYSAPVLLEGKALDLGVFVRETVNGQFQYDFTELQSRKVVGSQSLRTEGEGAEAPVAPALEVTPDDLNLFLLRDDFNEAASADQSKLGDLREALQERLRVVLGEKATLRTVDRIFNDRRIAGSYFRGLITVALNSIQSPEVTLNHEIVHALRDLGLFKPAEWTALRKAALADTALMADVRRRYAGQRLDEDGLIEEAVADMFAAWSTGKRSERGFVAAAFERVREFLRALGTALRGSFTSAEAVMRAIESGQIGSRTGTLSASERTRLMVAWHGTPHDFDSFSLDKIGTGEGAQAFGWGLYFTGKKEVAEFYRDTLSRWRSDLSPPEGDIVRQWVKDSGGDWKRASEAYEAYVTGTGLRSPRIGEALARGRPGRTFEVDLPEDGEYLLWDANLDEQPSGVTEALEALPPPQGKEEYYPNFLRWVEGEVWTGGQAYRELARLIARRAVTITSGKAEKQASLALREAGVAGIKYLDGGSRAKGEGSYNYVIFDDSRVSVRAKFSLAPTDSDAFARWFGDSKVVDENGAPLVVYHGTRAEFMAFEHGKRKANPYFLDDNELGFFFDVSPGQPSDSGPWFGAAGFAGFKQVEGETVAPEGAHVIAAYLSMRNPKTLSYSDFSSAILKAGGGDALRSALKEQGYDGAIRLSPSGVPVHFVAFEPTQIKAVDNRGTFDPNDGRILYSIASARVRQERDSGRALGSARILFAGLTGLGGKGEAISEAVDAFRVRMQDRLLPLLRRQQKLEREGLGISDGMNAYVAEELMTGKAGYRLERLNDEMVEPLVEAIRAEKVTVEELEDYLYARHAPERNARIAKINPEFAAGTGSGMTDAEAAAIMKRLADKMPALERLAARVDAILEYGLQTRLEAGLLSQADVDLWKAQYRHYVPLRGRGDAEPERIRRAKGISVKGKESQRATGRKSRAGDLLAYTVFQAEEAIARAGQNEVGQALRELALANPDPEFWSIDKVRRVAVFNKAKGQVEYRAESRIAAEDADYTVSLKVDGEEHRVTFNRSNPEAVKVARAMRNLGSPQMGALTSFMAKVNRYLSFVNTAASPEFVITNAFRDLQTASFNLSAAEQKGLVTGVLKNWKGALGGALRGSFGKKDGEWGRWFEEFKASGGRVYYNQIDDVEVTSRKIRHHLERLDRSKLHPMSVATKTLDLIESLNNGVENAVRLATYRTARELGMSKQRSASLARNVTVNFTRKGEWGPYLNAWYLFYNASIQGSATILRSLRRSRKAQALAAGGVMLGAALELLNRMLSDDDEDGESFYSKISDFDKSRNIVIMLPGRGGEFVKIPLGYGLDAFPALGRMVAQIGAGDDWKRASGNFVTTVLSAFNPIGGDDNLFNAVAPTVLDPSVDLERNRDYADRPIMPDQSQFGPKEPDNQRHFKNVSELSKAASQLLNEISGGDKVVPGAIDVSPETLDHLGGVMLGAAGSLLGRTIDLPAKMIRGEASTNDVPLARKLYGDTPAWYDKAAFYTRLAEIEQEVSYGRDYIEQGDDEGLERLIASKADVLQLEKLAKEARKEMRGLRKERRQLDLATEQGSVEKGEAKALAAQLEEREKELIAAFNSRYLEAVERPVKP